MKTLRWIDKAVCLGNGKSRQELDLVKMKDYATVIGCNAIYRDFQCDILVALDSRMSHEVYRSGYAHKSICYLGYWTPVPNVVADSMLADKWYGKGQVDNEPNGCDEVVYHGADGVFTLMKGKNLGITYVTGVKPGDKVTDIDPSVDGFAYATGSRSVHLACELNAKEVFLVGHDLYSDDDKVNNIYAGTQSYANKEDLAANPDNPKEMYNWIMQHKNTFDKFKDIQFYKVNKGKQKTASTINEWSSCENLKYISVKEMEQKLYN